MTFFYKFRNAILIVVTAFAVLLFFGVVVLLTYINIEFGETSRYVFIIVKSNKSDAKNFIVTLNDIASKDIVFDNDGGIEVSISNPVYLSGSYPGNTRHDRVTINGIINDLTIKDSFLIQGRHPIYSGDCLYIFHVGVDGVVSHSKCKLISRLLPEQ